MKTIVILFLILVSVVSRASVISLPLGGKVTVDASEWSIQDTKALTGTSSLFFQHKQEKDLQGILLDGTVQEKGACVAGKSAVCDRLVPMKDKVSYQIVGQKFHGKDTYQNYVFAFTFPKEKEQKYLPILKKLKARMEFAK